MKKPKIITICGSTRFADLHQIIKWEFEKDGGVICLTINYLPESYMRAKKLKLEHIGEQEGNKEILDELHFRKIDISDEVFIINRDGYIGESTRNEINYAKNKGKIIRYLDDENKET